MRHVVVVGLALVVATWLVSTPSPAAPVDSRLRWEYCEVISRASAAAFGDRSKGREFNPFSGEPKGKAEAKADEKADEKAQPQPADPAQPQPKQTNLAASMFRLVTAEKEIQAKSWEELAEKLNAAPAKKDVPVSVHKLRVFDRLGSDGWELIEREASTGPSGNSAGTWTFKRRIQ